MEFLIITFRNGTTKRINGTSNEEDARWNANYYSPGVKFVQGFIKHGNEGAEETCKVYPTR
jgi:hypothetical protein